MDKRSSRWKFRLGIWERNGSGDTEYKLIYIGEKTKQQNSVRFQRTGTERSVLCAERVRGNMGVSLCSGVRPEFECQLCHILFVAAGKLLNLSKPQFPHLQNGIENSIFLRVDVSKIVYVKYLG